MNRVLNKIIIVTGGASGIGRATSLLFAQEGAVVAILDIDEKLGHAAIAEITAHGFKAKFWQMDATNEKSVGEAIDGVASKFGRIDVLVNNIGMIGDDKPTHELSEGEWDKVMNVNVKSTFFCTKHTIPHLKRAGGGSIVNMSSIHGLIGSPDFPANHASKGAVRMMSKTDAMLYAKDKIRVNSVHPGYIWTPLLETVAQKANVTPEEYREKFNNVTPLGRMGDAIEVAYALLFLASDESRFVTATELVVDGGYTGGRIL